MSIFQSFRLAIIGKLYGPVSHDVEVADVIVRAVGDRVQLDTYGSTPRHLTTSEARLLAEQIKLAADAAEQAGRVAS